MGTGNCIENPLLVLKEALEAGITMFQLREKGMNALIGEPLETFARECQQLCKAYKVPFIINDNVDLALRINADGVHVGQDDTQIEQIRLQFENKIIGVSVHTLNEMKKAVAGGADYVGIGPIYSTRSKADALAPAGVTFLREARATYLNFPIVAIGGITEDNARVPRRAGADGVAVISTICHSVNRKQTIALLW